MIKNTLRKLKLKLIAATDDWRFYFIFGSYFLITAGLEYSNDIIITILLGITGIIWMYNALLYFNSEEKDD